MPKDVIESFHSVRSLKIHYRDIESYVPKPIILIAFIVHSICLVQFATDYPLPSIHSCCPSPIILRLLWPVHITRNASPCPYLIVTISSALVGWIATQASKSLFLAPILTATANPCNISPPQTYQMQPHNPLFYPSQIILNSVDFEIAGAILLQSFRFRETNCPYFWVCKDNGRDEGVGDSGLRELGRSEESVG
ncbi:hypothetical protein EYC80_004219 [Monilinia laxa]|uniref:Uncharacterized protein n=1 Tax=Monilinia laxa TaxID=61186 RepID=A0A5N6KMP4_MONLA|nr:hypothetical protein EYC80_004219 [Monilinia laxa]